MKTKAQILAESGLKTTQVIDSIRTFVLPMSEFLLGHSNLSLTKLAQVDKFLRKLINRKLVAYPSPKKYPILEQRMVVLACMRYTTDITYAK
jgi:hypothetical protein